MVVIPAYIIFVVYLFKPDNPETALKNWNDLRKIAEAKMKKKPSKHLGLSHKRLVGDRVFHPELGDCVVAEVLQPDIDTVPVRYVLRVSNTGETKTVSSDEM